MEIYGVYVSRLLRTDEFTHMMHSVSEERRAKVQSFIKPEDAARGLIGEALIRAVVRSKFNMPNHQIVFTTERYGKPVVAGLPSFHFNIAHSGRWILCAVDAAPVGIDIEEIKPVTLDIAKYYFSPEEYRWLMDKQEPQRTSCFYDIWTLKESFIKWIGQGLSFPLNAFSLIIETDQTICPQLPDQYNTCVFKQLDVGAQYKSAVCTTTEGCPERIILKAMDDLLI
jgi:4'-phosphopantetheinyl transferase